jgi:hypothetical protein
MEIPIDGLVNAVDVERMIDEPLGTGSLSNDLNTDGKVDAVDVQIGTNAAAELAVNSGSAPAGTRSGFL